MMPLLAFNKSRGPKGPQILGKRITMLTVGSRGDVEPFLALGRELRTRGHTVTLATHRAFRDLILGRGLEFAPVAGDPGEMLASEAGQRWLRSGQDPWEFLRGFVELTRPLLRQVLRDSSEAAQNADAILWTQLSFAGFHIAKALDLPNLMVGFQPLTPTGEFAPAGAAREMPLPILNRFSHWLSVQLLWLPFRRIVNNWLVEDLGLEPYGLLSPLTEFQRQGHPTLYAYSPSLVPKPAEWGRNVHVTGYWFTDESASWEPARDLTRFLDAGPRPIYIGFGSMALSDPDRRMAAFRDALRATGCRAVILAGPVAAGKEPDEDHIFLTEPVPHSWLLPRTRAAVHHGGAGTTAAALRAGVPQIVVPHFADQYFWAGRVARAGLGPQPIPRQELDGGALSERLRVLLGDKRFSQAAVRMGQRVRAEDGVSAAVAAIEGRLERAGFLP